MNILRIDTTDNKKLFLSLKANGKETTTKREYDSPKSDSLLPEIKTLLSKSNIHPSSLTNIEVNNGPGSFTGIRVGLSVANTLAYLLAIPVNGKEAEKAIYE